MQVVVVSGCDFVLMIAVQNLPYILDNITAHASIHQLQVLAEK